MLYLMVEEKVYYIVVKMTGSQSLKGYQPLISKSCSILRITHPSPPYRLIGHNQVFLIDRNVTVKLSSIKTIHVKLQHNVGFLIFKYTLKYMLVNVYINKMNIRKWLYIISYIIGEVFFPCFQFLCCIQRNPSRLISNSQEEKTLSYYVRLFQEIFSTCVAKCTRKYCQAYDGVHFSFSKILQLSKKVLCADTQYSQQTIISILN